MRPWRVPVVVIVAVTAAILALAWWPAADPPHSPAEPSVQDGAEPGGGCCA